MSDIPRDCIDISLFPLLLGSIGDHPEQKSLIFSYRDYVRFIATLEYFEPPDVELVLSQSAGHLFVIVRQTKFVSLLAAVDVVGEIDGAHYLATHLDVAAAVENGMLMSARDHYVFQGYLERRAMRLATQGPQHDA